MTIDLLYGTLEICVLFYNIRDNTNLLVLLET